MEEVMEAVYRLKPLLPCLEEEVVRVGNATTSEMRVGSTANCCYLQLEAPQQNNVTESSSDMSDRMIKIQIANHPLYPDLLSAYIECQKVIHSYILYRISFLCLIIYI